jgi:hypothetical protein
MKHILKEYQQAFLLEPTKLNRLVGKIHERLADHANSASHDSFEVFLTGNRREEMTSTDDVLALDNSRKQKIERLVIVCSASAPGAVRPEHEVQVDFGYRKPGNTPPSSKTTAAISVRSDAGAWATRALSEVEEQVERTWIHRSWPIGSLVVLAILLPILLVFLTFPLIPFRTEPPRAENLWLNSSDVDRIEAMLGERPILTDENLREVATMQLRNVLGLPRHTRPISASQVTRTLLLAVPLFVVLACVLVLVATCYPSAVFLWGDEVERYANTLQRRKITWNIIVSVTVVGVLSQVLVEGLSYWLPR